MEQYKVCSRCVMDTSSPDITFDEKGYCNFCSDYLVAHSQEAGVFQSKLARKDHFIQKVKRSGKASYDCVVGLSGGVDSSYALYLAVKNGLRPLAVHLDNGWNSEVAVHNISNLVNKLRVDLYTHVIDWEENRDMQISFFKANVVDIEMLMDNAMQALNYEQAAKHGVKYILGGTNHATEGLRIPKGWNHFKRDKKNILNIHRRFGSKKIKTHPLIGSFKYIYFRIFRGVVWESFLDYFPYNKEEAIKVLTAEIGYKPYPYKHYESVFTRFYQGYILPQKFGIDKRRLHFSNLICSEQMTRAEALEKLKEDPYPNLSQKAEDRSFVLKKLGFSEECFLNYLKAPAVPHEVYGTEIPLWEKFVRVNAWIRKVITG